MSKDDYLAALDRLNDLIADGWTRGLHEVNTASLATADTSARPSVRIVNIIAIEPEGLVFFANANSGKARQIASNPKASLCFYWPVLQEEVIIDGDVHRAQEAASNEYWKKVPREKQVYSSIDKDFAQIKSPGTLQATVTQQWSQFGFDSIERPADWHAFILQPDRIEFWPSGWRRAQERIRYSKTNDGEWYKELLAI